MISRLLPAGFDHHRRSWDAVTSVASTHGGTVAKRGMHSQARTLSETSVATHDHESHPSAMSPGHKAHDLKPKVVDSLALTMVPVTNTGAPHEQKDTLQHISGGEPEFTADPQPQSLSQPDSFGHHQEFGGRRHDSTSQPHSYHEENLQRLAADPTLAAPPDRFTGAAEHAGQTVQACRDHRQDGFDDGLRDLVARLDEIQRKQAAALADINDNNPLNAPAGGLCGEEGSRNTEILRTYDNWASRQAEYSYTDGIPTPESVLGVKMSPAAISPPLNVTNTFAQKLSPGAHCHLTLPTSYHRSSALAIGDILPPCTVMHGDEAPVPRMCSHEDSDGFRQPSSGTSMNAPTETLFSESSLGWQRVSRDIGRTRTLQTPTLSSESHPLHQSSDSERPACIPDVHSRHSRIHLRSQTGPVQLKQQFDTPTPHSYVCQHSAASGHEAAAPRVSSITSSAERKYHPPGDTSHKASLSHVSNVASAWRSRVYMRHKHGRIALQDRTAAAITPTPVALRAQSPFPFTSRSVSILDAAARQCSERKDTAQAQPSVNASMDAVSVHSSASAMPRTHVTSTPSSVTPPMRNELGTPHLHASRSAADEHHLGQHMGKFNSVSAASGSVRRATPWQRRSSPAPVQMSTGDSVFARQAPSRTEPLRCSGPPQYGDLGPSRSQSSEGASLFKANVS
jgi:hypothetical protein